MPLNYDSFAAEEDFGQPSGDVGYFAPEDVDVSAPSPAPAAPTPAAPSPAPVAATPAPSPAPVSAEQYEKLAGQLKRSWQSAGYQDSIGGVSLNDRAMALAKQLAQLGVQDLEKLGTGSTSRYTGADSRAPAGQIVDWGQYRGAPYQTYTYLSYDGKPIGYIPNSPNATSISADPYDPSKVGVLDLWDPAGKGHVKFIPSAQGPGGLVGFTPQWGSSSDLPAEVVAVIGVALTLSGAGAALGGAITSSLGIGASAAMNAFIGNTIMQTVLNGGDIGDAVKSSIASWAGAQVGDYVGNAAKSLFSNPDGLRLISNVANQATRAAILGQDVESAVKNTVIAGAVDFATAKIPNFDSLPKAVQDTVRQSINAAVQGKDIDAGTMLANAAKEGLLSYGLTQVPGFNDADPRTKSFVTTMLRTAIDQGDLSQSAVNWAVGQAQQEFQKVVKAGPALDELKKAGVIPEASYYGLNDEQKQLVDNFVKQADPKAAAAKYINSLSTTDAEIRQFYKELTGREPTEEDKELLGRFTGGLDEATARTGLDNQIRADAAANELRFDRLQSVLTNSRSTEQDLANVMNEYGITPAFIERVTGRKYDEISSEITARSRPVTQEPVSGGATDTTATTGATTDSGDAATGTAAAGAGQAAPFDFSKLNITHENQRKAAEVIRQELGDAALNDPNWLKYLNEGGLSAAASNIFAGTEDHLREQLRLMKSGQAGSLGLPQDALTKQLAAGYDIGDYKAPAGYSIAAPGERLSDIAYTAAGVPVNLAQRIEITGKYLPTESGEVAKNVMDAVKGTWLEAPAAMGIGAMGELGQTFAGGASWFFNLPATHSLNRSFNEITKAAETGVPQDVKDQWKNWQENVGKAEGFWGTIWAGMRNAPENFKGILWETGKEILQELPMLGTGLLVRGTAAGLALAEKTAARLGVSVATAMEMLENGGAAYNDAVNQTLQKLDPLVKEGKMTREEALYLAHGNGGQALLYGAGITGVISRVPGGNSLIEQIVGGNRLSGAANLAQSIATAATTGGKSAVKEFFSEGFEGGLTDIGTQYAVTGKVNPQQAAYAAITGAFIGGTTTGSISTLDSLKANLQNAYSGQDPNTVIGIDPKTGQDVTLGQTLQALDVKRQELGGESRSSAVEGSDAGTSGVAAAGTTAGAGTGTTAGTTTGATTEGSSAATDAGVTAGATVGGDTAGIDSGVTAGTAAVSSQDQAAIEQAERDRIATAQAEQERLAAEERERVLRQQADAAAEQAERERQAALAESRRQTELAEQARLAKEAEDQARAESAARQAQAEADRQAQLAAEAKALQERLAAEQAERERVAAEKAEQERIAAEKAEQDRLAAEKAERDRLAAEQAERERLAAEQAEQDRITREQQEQIERDRIAAEQAERDQIEREGAAAGAGAGTTTGTTAGTAAGTTTGTTGGTTAAGTAAGTTTDTTGGTAAGTTAGTTVDTAAGTTTTGGTAGAAEGTTAGTDAGTTSTSTSTAGGGVAQLTTADVAKIVNDAIAANPGLQSADVQAAISQALASLPAGLTTADVNNAITTALAGLPAGVTPQQMQQAIGSAVSGLSTDVTEQIGDLGTSLSAAIDAAKEAGLQGDQALQKAIDQVAEQSNQSRDQVLTQLGKTEQQLRTEFGTQLSGVTTAMEQQTRQQQEALANVESRLDTRIEELMQQGMTYQTATRTAIDEIDREIGNVRTELGTDIRGIGSAFADYKLSQEAAEAKRQEDARKAAEQARSQSMMQQALTTLGVGAAAGPVENYFAKFKDPLTTRVTQDKFESPLDAFLKQVETGSYTDPLKSTSSQERPDRISGERQMPDYFNYGQVNEIDDLLRLPQEQSDTSGLPYRSGGFVPGYAEGGIIPGYAGGGALPVVPFAGKHRVDFRKGSAVHGPGDGQSDDIPAMLADGEYVFDAETVAALGNGSTKAGANVLDKMRLAIRRHKRNGPLDEIPPPSKSPLEYLAEGMNRRGKKG